MSVSQPRLTIDYSTDFSLDIQFSEEDQHAPLGYFDFSCHVHHFTGQFTYTRRNTCFAPQTFHDFAGQLDAIRKGTAQRAEFHEVADMIVFSVEVHGRDTTASLRIRQHQLNGEETWLSAGFRVDYDLFVNALYRRACEFFRDLVGTDSD